MIYIILLFTFIFSLKSILLSEYYTNLLQYFYFPIELSLLSFDINSKFITYNSITKWLLFGFTKSKNDIKLINKIEKYNDYSIIISIVLSIIIHLLYFVIKYRKELDKYKIIEYLLKYLLINYLPLYILNLNDIINYENTHYLLPLILNVFLFNFIAFWFPGILFKYIYGDEIYIYRNKYKFLIEYYHPKYKYFTILLLGFKSLSLVFILLYNKYNILSNYSLILLNLLLIIFQIVINDLFNISKLLKKNIFIIILSILAIILNIIESYYSNIFYLKIPVFILLLLLSVYFNKKNVLSESEEIEMNHLL